MTDLQAKSLAELLVIGDGSPRNRGDVIKEVARVLLSTYEKGVKAGRDEQRTLAMSEAKNAIDGALQALNAARNRMDRP